MQLGDAKKVRPEYRGGMDEGTADATNVGHRDILATGVPHLAEYLAQELVRECDMDWGCCVMDEGEIQDDLACPLDLCATIYRVRHA